MANFIKLFNYANAAKANFLTIKQYEVSKREKALPAKLTVDYAIEKYKETLKNLKEVSFVLPKYQLNESTIKEIKVPAKVVFLTKFHTVLTADIPDEYDPEVFKIRHMLVFENDDIRWEPKIKLDRNKMEELAEEK